MAGLGLTNEELQAEIARQIGRLDEAQEEEEQLGPYAELMRMAALTAYQRAADLILANNERIAEQLARAGVLLGSEETTTRER